MGITFHFKNFIGSDLILIFDNQSVYVLRFEKKILSKQRSEKFGIEMLNLQAFLVKPFLQFDEKLIRIL